jgi:hypothetical protein
MRKYISIFVVIMVLVPFLSTNKVPSLNLAFPTGDSGQGGNKPFVEEMPSFSVASIVNPCQCLLSGGCQTFKACESRNQKVVEKNTKGTVYCPPCAAGHQCPTIKACTPREDQSPKDGLSNVTVGQAQLDQ